MLSSQRIEMKLKLECGFRKYCKQKNILLHCTEKLIKILLEPEVDNLKMIQYKFNKFQRMMLRKTQVNITLILNSLNFKILKFFNLAFSFILGIRKNKKSTI